VDLLTKNITALTLAKTYFNLTLILLAWMSGEVGKEVRRYEAGSKKLCLVVYLFSCLVEVKR
jgi:hypothetical protein